MRKLGSTSNKGYGKIYKKRILIELNSTLKCILLKKDDIKICRSVDDGSKRHFK